MSISVSLDGPFSEAKEISAGFALYQLGSMEDAVKWTERFLEVAGEGESELRLLHDADVQGAGVTQQ